MESFKVSGEELVRKIKELIREGNATRIIIKDMKGNTFMEIPLTIGMVGAAMAPVLAAIGALAALVSDFTIEIIKKEE
ncbi:MAG: DUF4342 domain-containing protein [Bacteroidales bacterium]|jgi:hypothetical protein|nr:DUF4342 domain-containing protein [Bacteroidales bacterium]NPV36558.1 DUF4342 domain-containing protein [Bacteroidales bacterium]